MHNMEELHPVESWISFNMHELSQYGVSSEVGFAGDEEKNFLLESKIIILFSVFLTTKELNYGWRVPAGTHYIYISLSIQL